MMALRRPRSGALASVFVSLAFALGACGDDPPKRPACVDDGAVFTCGIGACAKTVLRCIDGRLQTCDPLAGAAPERCDGADNDCDGSADEGLVDCCGDGVVNGREVCEPDDLRGQTCESRGFYGGALACNDFTCTLDESACDGRCGDGVAEGDEPCDGSDLAGATCETLGQYPGTLRCVDCTLDETECGGACGDGILNGEEACDGSGAATTTCRDLGATDGTVTCSSTCALDTSDCSGELAFWADNHAAVLRGAEWLLTRNVGPNNGPAALAAMLLVPTGPEPDAPPRGWAGASEAEKEWMRTAVQAVGAAVRSGDVVHSDVGIVGLGPSIWALDLYLALGGPDVRLDATRTISELLGPAIDNLLDAQDTTERGAWGYNRIDPTGRVITTLNASLGLVYRSRRDRDVREAISSAAAWVESRLSNADSGSGVWAGIPSSSFGTAAAVVLLLIDDRLPSTPPVDRRLRFLDANWNPAAVTGPDAASWSSANAFTQWMISIALADVGSTDEVGATTDPVAAGYPREPASWFLDLAVDLRATQDTQGRFVPRAGAFDATGDHAFAMMVLSRYRLP